MIKLIATDIDGTLVNKKKELPPDFDEVVKALKDKGIQFAVASGRSISALEVQFAPYLDYISLICDNGALIVDRGKKLSSSVMPREKVIRIIDICEENGMVPLLCTPGMTYLADSDNGYKNEVMLYYNRRRVMKDLRQYDDEVTKVAVYQKDGIENNGLKVLEREFGSELAVQLSGFYWVDIMNPGISKGRGIEVLQQRLGADYESTMAFGDYLNDIEMLQSAYYSYAMENAHPAVRQTANFSTGSCEDFAVTKVIREMVLE